MNKNLRAKVIPYVFQPIFETGKEDKVIGYEALVRPVGVSPARYIRQAKETGCLENFEYDTFFNAITQFKKRNLKGKLFINSFPYIMLDKERLIYLKKLAGSMHRDIYIENLEYGLEIDKEKLTRKYETLKDIGFRVAVDDFGTGINSVSVVKLINPEIVKIDRSFITGCTSSQKKMNTVEIITDSIRAHNAKVLAEGVETKEEYEHLKELGVDYMQGYFLGMPQ